MDKRIRYSRAVENRRGCSDCVEQNAIPLRLCDEREFGSEHIGPWTDWQGNLDAELMIVGQEWGGERNYKEQSGTDLDKHDTNANLVDLVNSISKALGYRPIGSPSQYQGHEPLFKGAHYFTNSLLCLKSGGATKSKNDREPSPDATCYLHCCEKFLKEQIDIVQPLVLVTLGFRAYEATAGAYGLGTASTLVEAVESNPLHLTHRTILVPMFHTGYWGKTTRNRQNPEQQKLDWKRVERAVLESRERLGESLT